MNIVGLDCGRRNVKVVTDNKVFFISSYVGEWRERKLKDKSTNHLEVEFQDEKYFVGDLALEESEFCRSMMTDDKDHDDTLILALTALHQAGVEEANIVTGLPVSMHDEDRKRRMKNLLLGPWEITVNGVKKSIFIDTVDVAAEGGAAFWSNPKMGKIRIIDGGSKTVNYVTMNNKRYVDRDSGTLDFGFETNKSSNEKQFANRVAGELGKKWGSEDVVYTVGGNATVLAKYLKPYFKNVTPMDKALYANAIGFRNIGKIKYGI
ncbi:plasmid segregation protein ParM [Evansella vedderi]|uniref:Plasmid segregation protein ParM n=1 Tax=Evansella vedderi TaxID=38282 RepID=A0ABT9ZUM3_9BACI|nr:ParM/StbA family protein [Evansella vedderi]MDQ0254943.1 plasmid segregation protein ParM [Evansella vedderi]